MTNEFLRECRWRKIQNLGLSHEYKDASSSIGQWLRHLFGLTFLSPEQVGDCFVEDFYAEIPDDERVRKYADYLVDTYINENATFPPQVWAEKTASLTRTTNACEAFHSKFGRYCTSSHPNIHVFMKCLIAIQTDSYISMNAVKLNQKRCIKKDIIQRQQFIKSKIEQFEMNEIDRYNFVKCVSYKFNLSVL
jgi:hypothetical protein